MYNPELADKILKEIYSIYGVIGSADLARQVGCDQDELLKVINAIKNYNDLFVKIKTGYGNNEITINRNQHKEEQVKLFLHGGGFTSIQKSIESETKSQTERTQLELQHLKLEIASLQDLPLEQKRTRRLSIAAILISLLTILFEILKTFLLKA